MKRSTSKRKTKKESPPVSADEGDPKPKKTPPKKGKSHKANDPPPPPPPPQAVAHTVPGSQKPSSQPVRNKKGLESTSPQQPSKRQKTLASFLTPTSHLGYGSQSLSTTGPPTAHGEGTDDEDDDCKIVYQHRHSSKSLEQEFPTQPAATQHKRTKRFLKQIGDTPKATVPQQPSQSSPQHEDQSFLAEIVQQLESCNDSQEETPETRTDSEPNRPLIAHASSQAHGLSFLDDSGPLSQEDDGRRMLTDSEGIKPEPPEQSKVAAPFRPHEKAQEHQPPPQTSSFSMELDQDFDLNSVPEFALPAPPASIQPLPAAPVPLPPPAAPPANIAPTSKMPPPPPIANTPTPISSSQPARPFPRVSQFNMPKLKAPPTAPSPSPTPAKSPTPSSSAIVTSASQQPLARPAQFAPKPQGQFSKPTQPPVASRQFGPKTAPPPLATSSTQKTNSGVTVSPAMGGGNKKAAVTASQKQFGAVGLKPPTQPPAPSSTQRSVTASPVMLGGKTVPAPLPSKQFGVAARPPVGGLRVPPKPNTTPTVPALPPTPTPGPLAPAAPGGSGMAFEYDDFGDEFLTELDSVESKLVESQSQKQNGPPPKASQANNQVQAKPTNAVNNGAATASVVDDDLSGMDLSFWDEEWKPPVRAESSGADHKGAGTSSTSSAQERGVSKPPPSL